MSRALHILVLAAAALLATASAASAGPYTVYSCTTPGHAPTGLASWKFTASATREGGKIAVPFTGQPISDTCAGSQDPRSYPSIRLNIGALGYTGVDVDARITAELSAPDDTLITGGRIVWGGFLRGVTGPDPYGPPAAYVTTNVRSKVTPYGPDGAPLEPMLLRELNMPYGSQQTSAWGHWATRTVDTGRFTNELFPTVEGLRNGRYRKLVLEAGCTKFMGAARCYAELDIVRTEVTLVDEVAPSGNVTGLPSPTTRVAGTLRLDAEATDRGSGVRSFLVRAGDQTIATVAPTAAPATCRDAAPGGDPYEYTTTTPCSLEGSASIDVDTTQLGEGPTTLQVLAEDAAGNTTALHEPVAVVVDNLDPYAEDVRAAGRASCEVETAERWFNPGYVAGGEANGVPATGDAAITGSFPTTRSVIKRGKESSTVRYARTRTVHYESSPTVTGRLVAASGEPIRGARVYLAQRRTGGRWSLCASPSGETNGTGSYRLRAPARGTDREVMAVYFPQGNANTVVTGRVLQLRVRTGVRLTRPPRAVRNGTRVRFRGHIKGERLAATLVTLQVRVGRRGWRDFATVRARPDGTFAKRWRFRNSKGARYRFRAVVKPQADRPYAMGYSTSHLIVVR